MTKTKTITETTTHGEVEYEVVECDSCGNDVMTDEALDFQIGDREGKACSHCVEVGPIDFPHPNVPPKDWLILATISWPLTVVAALTTNNWREGDSQFFLAATIGCLIWVGVPLLLAVVL